MRSPLRHVTSRYVYVREPLLSGAKAGIKAPFPHSKGLLPYAERGKYVILAQSLVFFSRFWYGFHFLFHGFATKNPWRIIAVLFLELFLDFGESLGNYILIVVTRSDGAANEGKGVLVLRLHPPHEPSVPRNVVEVLLPLKNIHLIFLLAKPGKRKPHPFRDPAPE